MKTIMKTMALALALSTVSGYAGEEEETTSKKVGIIAQLCALPSQACSFVVNLPTNVQNLNRQDATTVVKGAVGGSALTLVYVLAKK